MRKVTIHDVAREAEVSISTVSRVLNGGGSVNQAMAEKVRRAALKLDYRPNAAARGLASGAYRMIGVVVPDLANPYFTDIFRATVAAAAGDGYRIVVSDSRGDFADELDACLSLVPSVDGLLLLSPRMPAADLRTLADQGVPVVMVNRKESGVGLATVLADNFTATYELCRLLAEHGHQRVTFITGSPYSWQSHERLRGVRAARDLGIESAVVQGEATIEAGYDATERALRASPTAIVAYNDLAAFGVITRLGELGLRVPQDMSVTGFDDIEIAKHVRPALTTVMSPKTELGEQAWTALRARFRGEAVAEVGLIPSPLVVRESVASAPVVVRSGAVATTP